LRLLKHPAISSATVKFRQNSPRHGKLVHILKPFAPMAPGVFLYYPSRHQMIPKLQAFTDHVKHRSAPPTKRAVTLMTGDCAG